MNIFSIPSPTCSAEHRAQSTFNYAGVYSLPSSVIILVFFSHCFIFLDHPAIIHEWHAWCSFNYSPAIHPGWALKIAWDGLAQPLWPVQKNTLPQTLNTGNHCCDSLLSSLVAFSVPPTTSAVFGQTRGLLLLSCLSLERFSLLLFLFFCLQHGYILILCRLSLLLSMTTDHRYTNAQIVISSPTSFSQLRPSSLTSSHLLLLTPLLTTSACSLEALQPPDHGHKPCQLCSKQTNTAKWPCWEFWPLSFKKSIKINFR